MHDVIQSQGSNMLVGSKSTAPRPGPPGWLQATGWYALPGMIVLVSRVVYEQTALTWRDGVQMVGFSLAHSHTVLLMWMVLSLILAIIYLLGVAAISACRLFRGELLPSSRMLAAGLFFWFPLYLFHMSFG